MRHQVDLPHSWRYKSHPTKYLHVVISVCVAPMASLKKYCKAMTLLHSEYDLILVLTHWGWVTPICVSKLAIIGSDNGLSPGRHQAIIWTNAGILLIEPLRTNFSEILIAIHTFSFKEMHFKMSSGKWRPFCLGLNVLNVMKYLTWCGPCFKIIQIGVT